MIQMNKLSQNQFWWPWTATKSQFFWWSLCEDTWCPNHLQNVSSTTPGAANFGKMHNDASHLQIVFIGLRCRHVHVILQKSHIWWLRTILKRLNETISKTSTPVQSRCIDRRRRRMSPVLGKGLSLGKSGNYFDESVLDGFGMIPFSCSKHDGDRHWSSNIFLTREFWTFDNEPYEGKSMLPPQVSVWRLKKP